uniref:Mitochondrial carrier protein n=1 Tax=Panagrolaimus sp. JU765 TaxID=591449 RepID=A0AC34RJV2_9BILA
MRKIPSNPSTHEVSHVTRKRPRYVDFFCGWSAGCIETVILYPQSKLIFRQQLFGLAVKDAVHQLKSEGVWLLYRGLLPPLLMRTTTRSIMFGMYDKYQQILGCENEKTGKRYSFTLCHAQAAFLCEEFYRGFSVIVFRNGTSNILFFTLREPLKHLVMDNVPGEKNSRVKHIFSDFASGSVLGASISTLFFPINVTKTRMQSTIGTPFISPFTAFESVWFERNRSVQELYRGVHLNFTRSLMAWGITNTAFEFLKRLFD